MAKVKPKKNSPLLERTTVAEEVVKNQELIDSIKTKAKSILIEMLPIDDISEMVLEDGSEMHNRITYTTSKLYELSSNIEDITEEGGGLMGSGVLNAIMVRKRFTGKESFVLERIHGKNRLDALKLLGRTEAPIVVLEDVSDKLARLMRTSENLEREDLNAYDEAYSVIEYILLVCPSFKNEENIKKLINKIKNWKQGKTSLTENEKIEYQAINEAFKKIKRYDINSFADRLSILSMNKIIIDAIRNQGLGYSQAKLISRKLKKDEDIKKIIEIPNIKNESITSLQTLIINYLNKDNPEKIPSTHKIDLMKTSFKSINKTAYKSINEEDKEFVDKKMKFILDALDEIKSKIPEKK